MTPGLLALARAYASLPGAPKMDPDHDGWTLARGLFRAAPTGILWRRGGDGWLPDLTDAATGGVMLDLLAEGGHTVCTFDSRPNRYAAMLNGHYEVYGATLAEAVARVAVAVGRAGP